MANPEQFFGMMMPYALEASRLTGIDPRVIIAQSALETGYGRSAPGNNYFGIKSHGQSGGNNLATTEVINGRSVRVNDSFRAYDSPRESALGYADFINRNPRYQKLKSAQGLDSQIAALGASGYATDPDYAAKIASIASKVPMGGTAMTTPTVGPDGPKGQEMYARPVPGSMAAQSQPSLTSSPPPPASPAPAAAQALAAGGSGNKMADIFGMMAAAPQQQAQFSPVQIMGPSGEQANALSSLVAALKGRMG